MITLSKSILLAATALFAMSSQAADPVVARAATFNPSTIVAAHCVNNSGTTCSVYTVPSGMVLHVSELATYVVNGTGVNAAGQWSLNNFTSVWLTIPNGYSAASSTADLYLPAGTNVVFNYSSAGGQAGGIDVSLFGTLSPSK